MKDLKKMTTEELTEELTEENWKKAKELFGSITMLVERFHDSIQEIQETVQTHPRINEYVELVAEQKTWD